MFVSPIISHTMHTHFTLSNRVLKLGNNSLSHIRVAGTSVHNRPIDKATDVGCFTVWVWLKQAWLRL